MKKIFLILICLFSIFCSQQITYCQNNTEIEKIEIITSSCTITKPIKYLTSTELSADGLILKDGVIAIIKWNPIGDGGSCRVSIKLGDEEIPINIWSDYNELKLIRVKMTNGHYNYTLKNSMFYFFHLMYLDNDGLNGYAFNSKIDEID